MNKKEEVIKELGPIAKVLNIKIDYVIDSKREYLVCDNTKICTSCTSVYGIREEFFGYVFLTEWKHRSLGAFENQVKRHIKQYWYDDNFNQPYLKLELNVIVVILYIFQLMVQMCRFVHIVAIKSIEMIV